MDKKEIPVIEIGIISAGSLHRVETEKLKKYNVLSN